MASLVQELEQDAYNSATSLSNMLRKAKAVAVKLQLQEPIEWVEAELNGYRAVRSLTTVGLGGLRKFGTRFMVGSP
jgi:Tfp pilus assembly protein FimT